MTSERLARLRAWSDTQAHVYGDGVKRLIEERAGLLAAAKEAAEGFDVVAADDMRLLALLRDAIAKAESP